MAVDTSSACQLGWAWIASAALPATCGVAIEVPDIKVPLVPVPLAVVKTLSTGAAPACWPKIARATRAQVPRTVTTSLPVTPAATYSAGSQPSEIPPDPVPCVSGSTTTCKDEPSLAAIPLASIALMLPLGESARASPGNDACESTAATLIALSPAPGDDVMYGAEPAF